MHGMPRERKYANHHDQRLEDITLRPGHNQKSYLVRTSLY